MKRRLFTLMILGIILCLHCSPAFGYQPGTLRSGMEGDEVRRLQQALIDQGYLSGTADGIFGTHTENAVRAFQKSTVSKLTVSPGRKRRTLFTAHPAPLPRRLLP